ncbi:MAG: alpha/beta hydrolase [Hyphomicrobiaceae bacterium]
MLNEIQPATAPDDAMARPAPNATTGAQAFEFGIRDLVYQDTGSKKRLARLYQPAGTAPFPMVVQVHGGAWNNKDRTDGQGLALDLVAAGIVVLSLDFRNAPEAPYPASLQDINYGIRWAKAHAHQFGSGPERVGILGTSSGGHQALLSAIRADYPAYTAIPLKEASDMDAKLAFAIAGWGVLYPFERYKLAKAQGKQEMISNHHTFFGTDEATQIDATPALIIERKEKVHLPPALTFQGTNDEWTSVEQAEQLGAIYRAAGGSMDVLLYEGERHTFVSEFPMKPNSVKAVAAVVEFIKKHAG